MSRGVLAVWTVLVAVAALLAGSTAPGSAHDDHGPGAPAHHAGPTATGDEPQLPPRFRDEVVIGGLQVPTSVAFAPDGTAFIAQKSGTVVSVDRQPDHTWDDPAPTTFADLRWEVHDYSDRGLLGVEVDPQFPERPYVYVVYAWDFDPRHPDQGAPAWGSVDGYYDDCAVPAGSGPDHDEPGCVIAARVSRLTAVPSDDGWVMAEGGEKPLVDDYCLQFNSHATGSVEIGPDGYLYATVGEGASFDFEDYGQVSNPCHDPRDEGGSLRSQDLTTTGDPVGLNGAVIRIDPDTGAGAPGNPIADRGPVARRAYAYGLRNPFRFTFRPGTSQLWVGDVGGNNFEEINRVSSRRDGRADNFGWPCFEGPGRNPAWDGLDKPICERLYRHPDRITRPWFSYRTRGGHVAPDDGCPTGTASVSGVQFVRRTSGYPDRFQGALVFSDYSRDCLWLLPRRDRGLPAHRAVPFVQDAANPVDLVTGPGGDLYYVDIGADNAVDGEGAIRRIHYYPGNRPPTVDLHADRRSGDLPLSVAYDAGGSTDPDGDPLSYEWDTDGDGLFDDATGPTYAATYDQADNATVSVRVSDPQGATARSSVIVYPGNHPPTLRIEAPAKGRRWAVGDLLRFAATATDPEDGEISPDHFSWSIAIHHCPSICHTHPYQTLDYQSEGQLQAPDHEYPSTLLFTVTVSDDREMSVRRSVELQPRHVRLGFVTRPKGLRITAGGEPGRQFHKTFIQGSRFTVSAPQVQRRHGHRFRFVRWSDGKARSHDVFAPTSPRTWTATYRRIGKG